MICMLTDCRPHQFLSFIQKGLLIPYQVYLVNELKKSRSWCKFLSVDYLTYKGQAWRYLWSCVALFPGPLFRRLLLPFVVSWFLASHQTLPPDKLLRQNSIVLASDFCLWSAAFDVTLSDLLSSDVSLPLAVWNFARVSFPCDSAHVVVKRSNFLTLRLHLLSVDDSSRPFRSIGFRYFIMRKRVVRWSPCS